MTPFRSSLLATLSNGTYTLTDLARLYNTSVYHIQNQLHRLQEEGYNVRIKGSEVCIQKEQYTWLGYVFIGVIVGLFFLMGCIE